MDSDVGLSMMVILVMCSCWNPIKFTDCSILIVMEAVTEGSFFTFAFIPCFNAIGQVTGRAGKRYDNFCRFSLCFLETTG